MSALDEWVTALRSGQYEQAESTLENITYDEDTEEVSLVGYCCLGVGCKVFDPDDTWSWRGAALPPPEFFVRLGLLETEADEVEEWDPHIDFPEDLTDRSRSADARLRDTVTCSGLNDSLHLPFDQIADLINYFGVYVRRV